MSDSHPHIWIVQYHRNESMMITEAWAVDVVTGGIEVIGAMMDEQAEMPGYKAWFEKQCQEKVRGKWRRQKERDGKGNAEGN